MNGADKMGLAILLLATLPFLVVTTALVRRTRKDGQENLPPRTSKGLIWLAGGIVAFVILMAIAMWIIGRALHGAVGGLL